MPAGDVSRVVTSATGTFAIMNDRRDWVSPGVPIPDQRTFMHLLCDAGSGVGHAAAANEVLHPGDGFGRAIIWALREVTRPTDEPLACLLERYAEAIKLERPETSFASVLSGLKFACSHVSELSLEEETRLAAALERFSCALTPRRSTIGQRIPRRDRSIAIRSRAVSHRTATPCRAKVKHHVRGRNFTRRSIGRRFPRVRYETACRTCRSESTRAVSPVRRETCDGSRGR